MQVYDTGHGHEASRGFGGRPSRRPIGTRAEGLSPARPPCRFNFRAAAEPVRVTMGGCGTGPRRGRPTTRRYLTALTTIEPCIMPMPQVSVTPANTKPAEDGAVPGPKRIEQDGARVRIVQARAANDLLEQDNVGLVRADGVCEQLDALRVAVERLRRRVVRRCRLVG